MLALIVTHLNTADLARALGRLRPGPVALIVLVLSPLAVLLRALRWRSLLPAGDQVPLHAYLGAYLVGALANSVLLGRFGDLVKARFICRPGVDFGCSLSVVVIDRLLEGLALLSVFDVILLRAPLPLWASRLAEVAGLTSLLALVALRVLFRFRTVLLRLTERSAASFSASFRGRLLRAADRLLSGCAALADYRRVLVALVLAFAVWGVEIATVALLLHTFSVPVPWPVAAVVLLVVLNFGMLVPMSPGSVGVYQLLCVFALSLWGVDRQLALALGIVMQTVLFVPLYLAGAVWLLVTMRSRKTPGPVPIVLAPELRY